MRDTNLGSKALFLAMSVAPTIAVAQADSTCDSNKENCDASSSSKIELVEVYGVASAPYQAERSGDLRKQFSLSETPQTLNILTQQQLKDSGKTDLKEVLSSQAGVTLGTGENGNAFGDRYIIRGHEARSDVFVDGLRDPGMTTRESFASEQIEITKGPSATFAGRGSSGGAVNSITKQASTEHNFNRVDAGIGSDDYYRVVLDSNIAIDEDNAVRVNLLKADETVPNREGIERGRQGALVSGRTAPLENLSFVADVYYLEANDVPDLGTYFDSDTRRPVSDIPVYAQSNDFLDTEVFSATLRTYYDINDSLRFYNATRWGTTENGYILTGASGTTRDATDTVAPGVDTIRLSTHQGWQEVDYAASQFNLFWDTTLFGLESNWVYGFEYTNESVDNGVFNITDNGVTNCTYTRRNTTEGFCILDGNGDLVEDANNLIQRSFEYGDPDAQSNIETLSLYAMNTVSLKDQTKIFLGLRQDYFDYENDIVSRGVASSYAYSDTLTNGHAGIVYDVNEIANVYFTYSTATNINGGESDVGSSCGYGGLCGDSDQVNRSSPETVENIELGTKWKLFDEKLLATAAIFQITKSDVMESVGDDDYAALGTLNTGKNRVDGIEISLAGAITDEISVQMSASHMNSEVLASIDSDNIGLALSNFAQDSVYLQLRYQPAERFAFGGAVTYKSEMYGGQPDTAAGYDLETGQYSVVVPEYTSFDLFANYYHSENVNFALNVGNVTDEEYWVSAYRSGAFMYIGEARSIRGTVTVKF